LITDIRNLDGVNFFVKVVLISQLRVTLFFVNSGNDVLACGTMNTFIASVDRLEERGRLTEADNLIQQAQVVKNAIGCGSISSVMQAETAETEGITHTPLS
jgi:hypothetical protein